MAHPDDTLHNLDRQYEEIKCQIDMIKKIQNDQNNYYDDLSRRCGEHLIAVEAAIKDEEKRQDEI